MDFGDGDGDPGARRCEEEAGFAPCLLFAMTADVMTVCFSA
jgi:hypothetical protein